MRHAKCISMFLALATLAAFVSCGSGAEEKPTVTTEGVDTTVTVGDNTEETRLEPDLPDVRYDGKTRDSCQGRAPTRWSDTTPRYVPTRRTARR